MTEEEAPLTLTAIARLAEVRPSAVANWRTRYADFPQEERIDGEAVYDFDAVAQWLDHRRIPKNALKPGEPHDTTYGHRFRHNTRAFDVFAADFSYAPINFRVELGSHTGLVTELARRHDLESLPERHIELILGMLYLRVRKPDRWTRLVRQDDMISIQKALDEMAREQGIESFSRQVDDHRKLSDFFHLVAGAHVPDPDDVPGLSRTVADLTAAISNRKRLEHHTPQSLVQLITQLIDVRHQDRIYDPFVRYGELLLGAARHAHEQGGWPTTATCDTPSNHQSRVALINAAVLDIDVNVEQRWALQTDARAANRYDAVVANPPFNLRPDAHIYRENDARWKYGGPPPNRANFAWLQHVIDSLSPRGRAAVLMPNGATFSQNPRERTIRAGMLADGVVECLVALPPGLFRSTGIPLTLWLLRKSMTSPTDVLFIDATDLGSLHDRTQRTLADDDIQKIVTEYRTWRTSRAMHKPVPGFSRSVPISEIEASELVLNPRVHVGTASEAVRARPSETLVAEARTRLAGLWDDESTTWGSIKRQLDQTDLTPLETHLAQLLLGKVCEILPGPNRVDHGALRGTHVPIVLPRNLRHNQISDTDMSAVSPTEAGRMSRYRLQAGDIVCTRTGGLGRNGLVSADQSGWLLGPGCVRLRPADKVDPAYLVHYLGTPQILDWLNRNGTGSAIPSISTKVLATLPLRLPPISRQREAGQLLRLLDLMALSFEQMASTAGQLGEALFPILSGEPSDP